MRPTTTTSIKRATDPLAAARCWARQLRPGASFPGFFFFNDTAPTEIYTLSLHDALPIYRRSDTDLDVSLPERRYDLAGRLDRKSTRLNSSHVEISYAVFCLKKKKKT